MYCTCGSYQSSTDIRIGWCGKCGRGNHYRPPTPEERRDWPDPPYDLSYGSYGPTECGRCGSRNHTSRDCSW